MLLFKSGDVKFLINMDLIVGIQPYGEGTILYGWGENNSVRVDDKFEDVLAQFNYSKVSE